MVRQSFMYAAILLQISDLCVGIISVRLFGDSLVAEGDGDFVLVILGELQCLGEIFFLLASEGIVDAADDQIAKAQVFRGKCQIFHRDPGVKRTPFVGAVSA